jgi:hypothetical protein
MGLSGSVVCSFKRMWRPQEDALRSAHMAGWDSDLPGLQISQPSGHSEHSWSCRKSWGAWAWVAGMWVPVQAKVSGATVQHLLTDSLQIPLL